LFAYRSSIAPNKRAVGEEGLAPSEIPRDKRDSGFGTDESNPETSNCLGSDGSAIVATCSHRHRDETATLGGVIDVHLFRRFATADAGTRQGASAQSVRSTTEGAIMSNDTSRPVGSPRYNYLTRPTVVLSGSHGTISGIAINDRLDDDGQPIYGRTSGDDSQVDPTRC
jgi:hypothetical protein